MYILAGRFVINSVLGSQCAFQAHFFKTGRREFQNRKFLFGWKVAEDREAAGEQHQGPEGLAGLGRGQDWGEARGQEEHLRPPVWGSAGGPGGESEEEEEQDGQESRHCPSSVGHFPRPHWVAHIPFTKVTLNINWCPSCNSLAGLCWRRRRNAKTQYKNWWRS